MPSDRYDVAVVGGGIVGLAVAREVLARRPGASLIVVDKQAEVAQHQTGHNSGVIHAGVYYAPGSLKARLCVEGAGLMQEFCAEHGIPHERCGKLIVAVRQDELGRLADLETRGHANGVPGLRRVGASEIAEIEPECRGIAALHSPATGIVDFAAVARAIEQELRGQGVTFALGCEITGIDRRAAGPAGRPAGGPASRAAKPAARSAHPAEAAAGRPAEPPAATSAGPAPAGPGRPARAATVLSHATGSIQADWVIVCAGLWSDRLAVSAGAPADPRVVPFRGAYLRIAPGQPRVVRGLVYPVPDPALPFLGVHVTRHIDGGVLLGPTALLVAARDVHRRPPHGLADTLRDAMTTLAWPGTWAVARTFWRTGLSELAMATSRRLFVEKCARYVPALASMPIEAHAISGIRAQAVGRDGRLVDDFAISHTPGATHVRNAPSPAATSSFALAREIVDRFDAASR